MAERDGDQVEMALIVADRFRLSPACLEPLITLCSADWHCAHEGVVSALGTLPTGRRSGVGDKVQDHPLIFGLHRRTTSLFATPELPNSMENQASRTRARVYPLR